MMRIIIGFYLHAKCGDVAYWCTDWPKVGQLTTPDDEAMNGGQRVMAFSPEKAYTTCRRCGGFAELKLKYFRAIPHEADLRREAATVGRRAFALQGLSTK